MSLNIVIKVLLGNRNYMITLLWRHLSWCQRSLGWYHGNRSSWPVWTTNHWWVEGYWETIGCLCCHGHVEPGTGWFNITMETVACYVQQCTSMFVNMTCILITHSIVCSCRDNVAWQHIMQISGWLLIDEATFAPLAAWDVWVDCLFTRHRLCHSTL